jgi:hypothetical protein
LGILHLRRLSGNTKGKGELKVLLGAQRGRKGKRNGKEKNSETREIIGRKKKKKPKRKRKREKEKE